MHNIVFLGAPAHGHTNPTLPVVQELVQRGKQVNYYNHDEFRPSIERTGAAFHPYPRTTISSTAISSAIQEGNLANLGLLLMAATSELLPPLLAKLPQHQPALVIFDSLAL